MYFPLTEFQRRWEKTYEEMQREGFETAVVFQKTGGAYDRAGHGLWLTNYASLASGQEIRGGPESAGRSFAAIILQQGREPELWINEPVDVTNLDLIATGDVRFAENLFSGVGARIKELGCERVAYVGDDLLPIGFYRDLEAASSGVTWIPKDDLLNEPQRIKSPLELDAYREMGQIASDALSALMHALIQGKSESEAAGLAAGIIVKAGGGYQRIAINHGSDAGQHFWSDPFYAFSKATPQAGDMLRGWVYGPLSKGLWIDPGRTAVCGNSPSVEQRAIVDDVLKVIDAVVDTTRVGVTPREVGLKTDAVAESVGYFDTPAGAIWELYGHGLGYYFTLPFVPAGLPADAEVPEQYELDRPYEAGMVLSSEAFLSRPGTGSATHEDIFILTDEGTEVITTTPRVFW